MQLLGSWSDPLQVQFETDIEAYQRVISAFQCRCQFCGTETRLTPKTPLGFFDICIRDRALPNEPRNWVPLCVMCSDLNSLAKLRGKGTFIEADWISQSQLSNLLRLSYAIAIRSEGDWKQLKQASERFLMAIDSIPTQWGEIHWDGNVDALSTTLSRLILPLSKQSYANCLRFRFDMSPYEDAIQFWSSKLEHDAIAALSPAKDNSPRDE